MTTENLPVLFRFDRDRFGDGEVTAVFPTLPGTDDVNTMTCYAHIGQHGACVSTWLWDTRPATPAEYAPLLAELRGIYETGPDACRLVIRQRISPNMRAARRDALRRATA